MTGLHFELIDNNAPKKEGKYFQSTEMNEQIHAGDTCKKQEQRYNHVIQLFYIYIYIQSTYLDTARSAPLLPVEWDRAASGA